MSQTDLIKNESITLAKESMVIYIADKFEQVCELKCKVSKFIIKFLFFTQKSKFVHSSPFPYLLPRTINHLSKFLIVTSDKKFTESIHKAFEKALNFAQIYEENRKVILRSFYRTKNLTIYETFKDANSENLSLILFPDKTKNLNGFPQYIVFTKYGNIYGKWIAFFETAAQKLNLTLNNIEIVVKNRTQKNFHPRVLSELKNLIEEDRMDFFITNLFRHVLLKTYSFFELCYLVPLPPKYSIYELVLILPLDYISWTCLGFTVAVSALAWRLFEGSGAHWNFLFGSYAVFLNQFVKIRV
jgi:hypothetical protein